MWAGVSETGNRVSGETRPRGGIRPPRPVVGGEPQILSYDGERPPADALFGALRRERLDACSETTNSVL